jgi:hypothetical protein
VEPRKEYVPDGHSVQVAEMALLEPRGPKKPNQQTLPLQDDDPAVAVHVPGVHSTQAEEAMEVAAT